MGANSVGEKQPSTHHERMAIRLLGTDNVRPYFEKLKQELFEEFNITPSPGTAADVVEWFSRCPADDVPQLFIVIRRALDFTLPADEHRPVRRAAEEAAAALYCLAACRLVNKAAHEARAPEFGNYVTAVPGNEHLISAIIATAVFGGELRLMAAEHPDLPRPEYVFDVPIPDGGDQIVADFQRAAYVAVFSNFSETPEIRLDDGPLKEQQIEDLAARFRTIRDIRRRSLALVVRGLNSPDGCREFASKHKVPVMVPETEGTTAILGMKVKTLLAEIKEFWRDLDVSRSASPSQDQPPPPASGDSAMPQSGQYIHVHGNAAISTGSHSAPLAGKGHSAHIDHRQGADLAVLIPLLQELAQEIGNLSSAEKRDELIAHVELAKHEAGKKDNPDPGRIKRALDVVKSGAEGLEHGGKIIALCNKTYNAVAPLLGLPPSPLP